MTAYASINFGLALLSVLTTSYMMYFYTDVVMLSPLATMWILSSVRLFDGVIDTFLGHYMDRRLRKSGGYLRYYKRWTIPVGLLSALLFVTPPFAGGAAAVWCFAVYIAWCFAYSIIEVASLPLMTSVTGEGNRVFINTAKIAACVLGALLASYLMMRWVAYFGGGSESRGFLIAGLLFAALGTVAIWIGALTFREKGAPKPNTAPFLKNIQAIFRDRSLLFLLAMYLCDQMAAVTKNQGALYFLKYVANRADILPPFLLVGVLSSLAFQPVIFLLTKRFKISRLMFWGYIISAASMLGLGAFANVPAALFTLNAVYGMASAIPANLIFVCAAERADRHGESENGATGGLISSMVGITSRIGYAVASAAFSAVLAYTAFVPNAAQTPLATGGIAGTFVVFTSVMLLLSGVFGTLAFSREI